MDARERREMQDGAGGQVVAVPFSFPVATGHYDRMLAAAHELALDVVASTAAAPVIDAEACVAWMAADFARDRREVQRPERRGAIRDRRRR